MMTSPTNGDIASRLTDPRDCLICYQEQSRKSIAVLACGHQLHRSCFLLICESHEVTELPCPACFIPFSFDDVHDEMEQKLPKIFGYGPTAQPSKFLLAKSLENTPPFAFLANELKTTDDWIQRNAIDIDKANESGNGEEYTQDLLQEREKLIRRAEIIRELQKERSEIDEDITTVYNKAAVDRRQIAISRNRSPNESIVAFTAAAAAVSEPVVGTSVAAVKSITAADGAAVCAVCLETLSSKRTVNILPCKHTFHQTCVMRWFESQSLGGLPQGQFSCCNCRTKPQKIVGEDGCTVLVSSVFEAEKDNWFCGRVFKTKELMESMAIERSTINTVYYRLSKQRSLALKEKRGHDWIVDIDEEMGKLRRRTPALDNFYFIAALTRKMDQSRARAGRHVPPAGNEGDNLHAGEYAHAVLSTHTSASFGIGTGLGPMPWPVLPHLPSSWGTPSLNADHHNPALPASRLFAPSFPLYNTDSGRLTYLSGLPYISNPLPFVGRSPAVPDNRGPVNGAPASDRSAALLQQPLRNLIEKGLAADPLTNANTSTSSRVHHPYMRPLPPIAGTSRMIPNGTRNSSSSASSSDPATGIPNPSSVSASSSAMPANHREPSHVPVSSGGLLMVRGHCVCADCTRVY